MTLLNEDNEHDVIIEAGEEPTVRKFKAHYYILRMRSPYFRQALSSRWAQQVNGFFHFKKPNISPETFEIILRYIYTSIINVEGLKEVEIIDVLGAADELCLTVLVEALQEKLMERKHLWINKQSVLIYNAGQKYPTCTKLLETMYEAIYQEPELLLKSEDFSALEVETVVWLLQKDDLGMLEIELWRRIVEWGIRQLPFQLDPDVTKWRDDDFILLKEKLRPCIPYIRWRHIGATDFAAQVTIYGKILPLELCEPDINGSSAFYNLPIYSEAMARIQSVLIDPHQAARIAKGKDKDDKDDKNEKGDDVVIGIGGTDLECEEELL
ncbi:10980_t:CDS:2 [Diversispora eburnea]|uniref:10980_t:CDS:1 n=1 Tax=Diversispora eburnea TaxID=1213867 RepID=A0A9N9ATX3_9GLOM|nr:10980_t:CDS:2 [Diversispora eburnea]